MAIYMTILRGENIVILSWSQYGRYQLPAGEVDMPEWSNSYHRGEWCLYRSLVCQEGVCCGCQIYLDAVSNAVKKVVQVEKTRQPEPVCAR
jgi:hypothetical protein